MGLVINMDQVEKTIKAMDAPYTITSFVISLLKIDSVVGLGGVFMIFLFDFSKDMAMSCKPSVTMFIHNN